MKMLDHVSYNSAIKGEMLDHVSYNSAIKGENVSIFVMLSCVALTVGTWTLGQNHNRGNESLGRDSEIVLKIEDHQSYKDVCVTQEFYADNNRDGCRDKERLRVYGIFEKEAHMRVWRRPTKSDEDLLVVFLWNLQPLEKTVMHRCCRVVVKTCVAWSMRRESVKEYMAKSLVVVSLGNNDYINNYLKPTLFLTSSIYDPTSFADLLLSNSTTHLLELYGKGFRKFVIAGVGPLGCIPDQVAARAAPPGECVEAVNEMAELFNNRLVSLVDRLNSDIVGLAGGEVSSETAMFPAMFVFGDSLVDNGNNNHLNSLARSNYLPYGIDFAGNQPTGRFSNGKTIVDFMGELLGLPEIPAFMDTVDGGVDILQGVNYASAAGGILEETGRHLNHNRGNESLGRDSEIVLKIEDHQSYKDVCVTQEFYADNNRAVREDGDAPVLPGGSQDMRGLGERFSMGRQVENFEKTLMEISRSMRRESVKEYMAKSLVVVSLGNNDYINNYLKPTLFLTSSIYDPTSFADLLLSNSTTHLLELYGKGFRKFVIAGVGPLGCIPDQLAARAAPPGECVEAVNEMAELFNNRLVSLVDRLNSDSKTASEAIFVYGNTYGAAVDILTNPFNYGFEVTDRGCCGVGRNRGEITCLPLAVPCAFRDRHVFWDAFHPTQAFNLIIALRAFNGSKSDCYPINLSQLSRL
ncbi:unnamed protein product [Arabidopsis lyrata]|nr:unnamed protein product [Arabidopsis lyrata]